MNVGKGKTFIRPPAIPKVFFVSAWESSLHCWLWKRYSLQSMVVGCLEGPLCFSGIWQLSGWPTSQWGASWYYQNSPLSLSLTNFRSTLACDWIATAGSWVTTGSVTLFQIHHFIRMKFPINPFSWSRMTWPSRCLVHRWCCWTAFGSGWPVGKVYREETWKVQQRSLPWSVELYIPIGKIKYNKRT